MRQCSGLMRGGMKEESQRKVNSEIVKRRSVTCTMMEERSWNPEEDAMKWDGGKQERERGRKKMKVCRW